MVLSGISSVASGFESVLGGCSDSNTEDTGEIPDNTNIIPGDIQKDIVNMKENNHPSTDTTSEI